MPYVTGTDSGDGAGNPRGRKGERKSDYSQTIGENEENAGNKVKKVQ